MSPSKREAPFASSFVQSCDGGDEKSSHMTAVQSVPEQNSEKGFTEMNEFIDNIYNYYKNYKKTTKKR